eukprot:9668-Heterococcus_DN1.PRE.2
MSSTSITASSTNNSGDTVGSRVVSSIVSSIVSSGMSSTSSSNSSGSGGSVEIVRAVYASVKAYRVLHACTVVAPGVAVLARSCLKHAACSWQQQVQQCPTIALYLHNAAVFSKVDLSLKVDVVSQCVVQYVNTGQLRRHLQISASTVIVYSRTDEAPLAPLCTTNAVV